MQGSEARIDLLRERVGVKESSTVKYGVQTVLAPPAYMSLSSFQRPPQSTHPRARFTHARKDAHDLHARLCVLPAAALFSISSSSTSSFARSHTTRIAGGVLLHAHGDLPSFLVRDATLVCAPFTRTVLRIPGRQGGTRACGAYMDLDETMIHTSFVPPPRATSLFFLLATFTLHHPFRASLRNPGPRRPSFLASPPVPLRTPTVLSLHCLLRVLGPCATSSAISSSIITTRDRDAHQALHNPTSIATLRTKARPKPKRSTTRITMCGRADTEVVRRVPALAFGCADVVPAFFDVLYLLRERPVWGLCSCPSRLMQHASRIALLHTKLADIGDLVGILILLQEGGGVAFWLSRLLTRHAFPLPGVFVFSTLIHSRCILRTLPRPCPSLAGWTSDE
ncbi:hypothetical protein K438DRAFT_1966019 [Mycena galopus ATCC 62051]|nr:hypothetical protein K438DRAFT_1966019 [Mycena galopus ATCC 62051]